MLNHTITRSNLCNILCAKLALKRQQLINFINTVVNEIVYGLVQEEHVRILPFRIFHIRQKNQRITRNFKTGKRPWLLLTSVFYFERHVP
ncbi:MAG: HU family DNA-binding protein [Alphaproteobacteria bacterium]|nr:HU family DNA-binding protein [Alphaproteobacteria bacterium]